MAELEPVTRDLPSDIVFSNILPRLPAKSILRFKCVSKKWHSFLTTPEFVKMHRLRENYKLLFLPRGRPWVFRTIDCETPEYGLTAERPFPFKVGPTQKLRIITSLHGMVCLHVTMPGKLFVFSDIILWNPVTDDHTKLSKAGLPHDYHKYILRFQLYYSSCENDYKLLCLSGLSSKFSAYIFSLKSDSWRKVESADRCSNTVLYNLMSCVLLNKKFHLLRDFFDFEGEFTAEKLRDIVIPPFPKQTTDFMGFMTVKGCTHFCVAIINSIGQYDQIELWLRDGNGFWELVTSFPNEQYVEYHSRPLHLMRNGNWLMYSRHDEFVYALDTKKQIIDIMCSINYAFRPEGKYMETFVSPNQYMN